jgi:hypothetical protein
MSVLPHHHPDQGYALSELYFDLDLNCDLAAFRSTPDFEL